MYRNKDWEYRSKPRRPEYTMFRTISNFNNPMNNLPPDKMRYLLELRSNKHGFRNPRDFINGVSAIHYNEPKTFIFLDIAGSIYESGTHGSGYGILGRNGDSEYIGANEITAIGDMIERTKSQEFTLPDYSINPNWEIIPNGSECLVPIQRIPIITGAPISASRPQYRTKYGPFTVVFISSYTAERQKAIVSILYYVYLIKARNVYRFNDLRGTEKDIIEIERLMKEKYGNDFNRFLEIENTNFAMLSKEEIDTFHETIDGLHFLSTTDTQKTKGELFTDFLESPKFKEKNGNSFTKACMMFTLGDSYTDDGEMLVQTFERGGVGFLRDRALNFESDLLTLKLAEKGIYLNYMPTVNSFSEFYGQVVDTLVWQREEELIDAMTNANLGIDGMAVFETAIAPMQLSRIKKT